MERRVARARGERTLEEKKDLENEIKTAEEDVLKVKKEHKTLLQSVKRLDDDLRAVERLLSTITQSKTRYT